MRLAVPISVACCTECLTSFSWGEYNRLPDAEGPRRLERSDGVKLTHKLCDMCGHTVTVSGFDELEAERLWRPYELHTRDRPESGRAPQLIPENNWERFVLWWRRQWFARVLAALLVAFFVLAMAVGQLR